MTFFQQWKYGSRLVSALLLVYLVCFLVATWNHARDIYVGGLFPYSKWHPELPGLLDVFWTSLVVIDPLVVGILLGNIRAGVRVCLAVMIVDVAVNVGFFTTQSGLDGCMNVFVIGQILFLGFVAFTFSVVDREVEQIRRPSNP